MTKNAITWIREDFRIEHNPALAYATENHHWKGENIYNFKQNSGHKNFFLPFGYS